jgi:TPP-dependent trihydroxycyclohexane-1,2-dione (THcHDO) dehydratase
MNALQVMMITRICILKLENYLLNQSIEIIGAVQEQIPPESAQLGSAGTWPGTIKSKWYFDNTNCTFIQN